MTPTLFLDEPCIVTRTIAFDRLPVGVSLLGLSRRVISAIFVFDVLSCRLDSSVLLVKIIISQPIWMLTVTQRAFSSVKRKPEKISIEGQDTQQHSDETPRYEMGS